MSPEDVGEGAGNVTENVGAGDDMSGRDTEILIDIPAVETWGGRYRDICRTWRRHVERMAS